MRLSEAVTQHFLKEFEINSESAKFEIIASDLSILFQLDAIARPRQLNR
jgi:hypothetical protein